MSFHSRLTYAAQGGRITAVAAVEDEASVASGSGAGSLHVWRVEVVAGRAGAGDRYTGGCRVMGGCIGLNDKVGCDQARERRHVRGGYLLAEGLFGCAGRGASAANHSTLHGNGASQPQASWASGS